MKCGEVSTLLVDFLYEEMPAEQRREFLAHVEGCASCSAEVKAMFSTLGHARAALRGPLAEEPPPRVRARVLEAAQAALAPNSARPQASRVPEPEGFFARLWKTPWLVPALGAVGVATAVFLVKVIKNPQVLPEQKPAVTEALTQPVAEPRSWPQVSGHAEREPEPRAAPPAPGPAEHGLATRATRPTAGIERDSHAEPRLAKEAVSGKLRTVPPARDRLATSRRNLSDDPLAGVLRETLEQAPAGLATASKGGRKAAPGSDELADAKTRRASASAMRADKDESSLDEPLRTSPPARKAPVAEGVGSLGRWAQPPPPRAAEAPAAPAPVVSAPAPPAAKPAPVEKANAVADLEDRVGSSVAREPVRSPAPVKAQAPARVAPASPAAQTEAPASKKQATEKKEAISFEERVRKAEKLFAEKKWAEAAAAFRALLAQAPSNPAAKTWRERVAAAELAQEQGRTVKAKTKLSDDALEGL